jgi:hypothetical protein
LYLGSTILFVLVMHKMEEKELSGLFGTNNRVACNAKSAECYVGLITSCKPGEWVRNRGNQFEKGSKRGDR